MVMAFDLEHRDPSITDVDGSRVLAGTLHHQLAAGRQRPEKLARRLVRAMLRPHDGEHPQLGKGGGAPENSFDALELVGAKPVRAGLREIDPRLAGKRSDPAHSAVSIIERKILRPSVPPSRGSTACSGCGIKPNTLKRSLATPAISRIAPLGFATSVSRPSSST